MSDSVGPKLELKYFPGHIKSECPFSTSLTHSTTMAVYTNITEWSDTWLAESLDNNNELGITKYDEWMWRAREKKLADEHKRMEEVVRVEEARKKVVEVEKARKKAREAEKRAQQLREGGQ